MVTELPSNLMTRAVLQKYTNNALPVGFVGLPPLQVNINSTPSLPRLLPIDVSLFIVFLHKVITGNVSH